MSSRLAPLFGDHVHTARVAQPLAEWMRRAACKGRGKVMEPPLGLPAAEQARRLSEAFSLCGGCLVYGECRVWVLDLPPECDPGGVCGGMTADERRKVREERDRRAKALLLNT